MPEGRSRIKEGRIKKLMDKANREFCDFRFDRARDLYGKVRGMAKKGDQSYIYATGVIGQAHFIDGFFVGKERKIRIKHLKEAIKFLEEAGYTNENDECGFLRSARQKLKILVKGS